MYDQCLSLNPGAYLPVRIALMKLYLKWLWLWMRGKAGPSRPFDKPPSSQLHNSQNSQSHSTSSSIEQLEEPIEESAFMNDNVLILLLLLLGSVLYYWRTRVVLDTLPRHPLEDTPMDLDHDLDSDLPEDSNSKSDSENELKDLQDSENEFIKRKNPYTLINE